MLSSTRRLAGLLGAASIAAALSCSDAADPSQQPILRPGVEAYREAVARGTDVACGQLLACASTWGPMVPDLETCRGLGPDLFDTGIDPAFLAVHALDDAVFDQCMTARATGCDAPDPDVIAGCLDTALAGVLAEGACCDVLGGCMTGLVCTAPDGEIGACWPVAGSGLDCHAARCDAGLYCNAQDVCTPLPSAGQPCSPAGECAASAYCSGYPGTCVAYPGAGQSCSATYTCAAGLRCDPADFTCKANAPDYCDLWTPCPDGQRCDHATTTCVAPSPLAGACTSDGDCPPAAACVYEGSSGSFCRANALEGAACSDIGYLAPPCASSFGLSCVSGHCVAAPSIDQPCVPGTDVCRPVDAAYCDDATATCRARGAIGDPCATSQSGTGACVPGASCSSDLGICVPTAVRTQGGLRCPP